MAPTRSIFRFAAGRDGLAHSGIWRLWSAKHESDLYLAIRVLGGITKASIHAPRPPRHLGWRRHYGFAHGAESDVAKSATQAGGRHKLTWQGRQFPGDVTLEWRILIRGSSLRTTPIEVEPAVTLFPIPREDELLEIMIFLGPPNWTDNPLNVKLIGEGRLLNGWRFCLVYALQTFDPARTPSQKFQAKGYGLSNLASAPRELRAVALSLLDDGTLGLWDARVENTKSTIDPAN